MTLAEINWNSEKSQMLLIKKYNYEKKNRFFISGLLFYRPM